jgi:phosphate transport system substrate-binding protein
MIRVGQILFLAAFFCSCTIAPKDRLTTQLTSGLTRIACSEEFQNLIESEINAFSGIYDSAYIIPYYRSETEIMRLLTEDSVNIAISTRDVNDRERHALDEKNLVVHKSIIAFDGVAIVNNPQNSDSVLSQIHIEKILRGEITDWSELDPENKTGQIRILFDSRQSGVFRYVIDSILKKNTEHISTNLYELGSTEAVIEKTAEMPNALGFIASNHVSDDYNRKCAQTLAKIRLVRIGRNAEVSVKNSYLPYAGDIRTENYPFWRSVYVLVTEPRSGLSSGFAVFLANQIGQKVVQKSGLLAITDAHNIAVEISDEFPPLPQGQNKR